MSNNAPTLRNTGHQSSHVYGRTQIERNRAQEEAKNSDDIIVGSCTQGVNIESNLIEPSI